MTDRDKEKDRQDAGRNKKQSDHLPRRIYLPIIALAVEFLFFKGSFPEWFVFLTEYSLLFWFVLLNLRNWGSGPYFIGVGTLLNFAVIVANGFRMPVWPSFFAERGSIELMNALIKDEIFGYAAMGPGSKLPILADIIGISFYGDLVGFASIGDLFLLLGAVILIYHIVTCSKGSHISDE